MTNQQRVRIAIIGTIAIAFVTLIVTLATPPAHASPNERSAALPASVGAAVPTKVVKDIFGTRELPPLTRPVDHPAQNGAEPSAYTGDAYNPADEDIRRCITRRESRNTYGVIGATGTYRGAYQVSTDLARGMTWHIRDTLIEDGVPGEVAKRIAAGLRDVPINRWSREYQDLGFWATLNYDGKKRSGAHHWGTFGQTYSCF